MNNDNNFLKETSALAFSLFSFKTKMIIIGVVIGVFLIILIPIAALSSVTGGLNTEKKGGTTSSSSSSSSGTVVSDNIKKYENASFIMPFECWDSSKDLVTSPFGYRSDPFTRKVSIS